MDPFYLLILSVWLDRILNKRHSQPCYFEFFTSCFFFSSCESQGANTRKRGRLSHMLRLIYLKVFLRAQSLDAWILLACVWWMKILHFLVFTFLRNRGGPFILSGIRNSVVIWFFDYITLLLLHLMSRIELCCSPLSKCYISAGMHIQALHYLLICLIVSFKDSRESI